MDIFMIHYKGPIAMVLLPVIFMVIDIITGFSAALYKDKLDSTKMRSGLFKKVGELSSLILVLAIVEMTNVPTSIGPLVSVYICFYELISIVENLSKLGVKVPSFIKTTIDNTKNKLEKGEINDD